jgi:hypothetical protein
MIYEKEKHTNGQFVPVKSQPKRARPTSTISRF